MLKMINATTLRTSSNDALTPQLSSDATDPAGFASLLRQSQVASAPAPAMQRTEALAHHEAAAAPAAPARQNETKTESSANEETASAESEAAASTADAAGRARTQAQGKTKVRPTSGDAGGASQTKSAVTGDGETTSTAVEAKAANGGTTATTTGVVAADPALAQWLASLQRPAAAPAGTDRGGAKADDTTAAPGSSESGGARALKAADLKAQDEVNAKAAHGDDRFKAEFNPAASSSVVAEQRVNEVTSSKSSGVGGPTELASAGGAMPAAPQTSVREAEAPTVVALPTPVDAPDFAQALGVQLSVLTRDGVQSAELHLNPADMGPVSVQIVMDGTQARVDFGADMAATRQAIEAGLPELASALRDAGFTLAGGGVSQHSSGRGDAGASNGQDGGSERRGGARRVSNDTVGRVGNAARRLVTVGGLDLYA